MASPDFPPQPWITFQRGGGQQIKDADEDVFAEVVCYPRKREVDTSTLFAAAPDLLSSLKALVEDIEQWEDAVNEIIQFRREYPWGNLDDARAAIKKAEAH